MLSERRIMPQTEKMVSDQQTMPQKELKVSDSFTKHLAKESSRQSQDITGITGVHLIYTYENGWLYEIYVKNATTLDYRIHSGPVARRWVKNQTINVVQLSGKDRYKISWAEPTGTTVSLVVNLETRQHHGVIFFPQWVHQDGTKTALFQNDHLDEMMRLRNAGPTYPIDVVDEFAELMLVKDQGVDNEEVISVCPTEFAPTLARIIAENKLTHKFGAKWGCRDTSDLVGKHLVYTYENGWQHELYVRSASSIDYRVHSGIGSWRLAKNQTAAIVRLTGSNRYVISSTEVAGTSHSLSLDLDLLELHGVIFFPQWVLKNSEELTQIVSDHERPNRLPVLHDEDLIAFPDARPIYPLHVFSSFAEISSIEDCGAENDSVIR